MAKSRETYNKKEKEKKRQKKKQDKLEKKAERRTQSNKGKTLEEMYVYVDENGNISDTPPDPSKKTKIIAENIAVSVAKQSPANPEDLIRKGVVNFFNTLKLYGFIRDSQSQENIFFHQNDAAEPIAQNDRVQFEIERGPKGWTAVRIKKILN